ncbi:MAG: FixH family protein [Nitratireductor sp.]
MQPATNSPRRFTGWHMLAVMFLFFGTVIGVNVTMAVLASTSWTGLVVKNSYVAGQTFNEENEIARKQAALGYKGRINFETGMLVFRLDDRDGKPIFLDNVKVKIGRPAFEGKDRTITLDHAGRGIYRAGITLEPGIWSAQLDATLPDGSNWRMVDRLRVAMTTEPAK